MTSDFEDHFTLWRSLKNHHHPLLVCHHRSGCCTRARATAVDPVGVRGGLERRAKTTTRRRRAQRMKKTRMRRMRRMRRKKKKRVNRNRSSSSSTESNRSSSSSHRHCWGSCCIFLLITVTQNNPERWNDDCNDPRRRNGPIRVNQIEIFHARWQRAVASPPPKTKATDQDQCAFAVQWHNQILKLASEIGRKAKHKLVNCKSMDGSCEWPFLEWEDESKILPCPKSIERPSYHSEWTNEPSILDSKTDLQREPKEKVNRRKKERKKERGCKPISITDLTGP